MNKLYLNNGDASRLIVIFLGWGFPPEVFSQLAKCGYHILLISGYDSHYAPSEVESFIKAQTSVAGQVRYKELIVIGWSFGVKAAELFLAETELPITLRLAVNGTEYHINNDKGIPEAIFNGTLQGLIDKSLYKFLLRSAGSKTRLDNLFQKIETDYISTNLEELRSQLHWFSTIPATPISPLYHRWDKVIIGDEDRIFPPQNQRNAWSGHDQFIVAGMAHVPDFQWILDHFIVDKLKVGKKFGLASATYTNNAIVQQTTAHKLYQYFLSVFDNSLLKSNPDSAKGNRWSVLELGYGDGMFTRLYAPSFLAHCAQLTLSDIQSHQLDTVLGLDNIEESLRSYDIDIQQVTTDVESADFAQQHLQENSRDIIFSASMFQWLNSPATMLRRCSNAMKPNGIIAISFYGPGTLAEISSTVGNGLKYPSKTWMQQVATECNLTINLIEADKEVLTFPTATDAIRHLRLTGVNALSEQTSPAKMRHLLNNWPKDNEGKATLTFCPIYMVLTKN